VTIDEELILLEENVRRLKVEYDIYFNGGARRAPTDLDWRVQGQDQEVLRQPEVEGPRSAFKYNTVVQRYATYTICGGRNLESGKKVIGARRMRLHGIQGLRPVETAPSPKPPKAGLRCCCSQTRTSWKALGSCTRRSKAARAGTKHVAPWKTFAAFLRAKTKEIQNTYGCSGVKYTVEVKERTGANQGQTERVGFHVSSFRFQSFARIPHISPNHSGDFKVSRFKFHVSRLHSFENLKI